MTTRQTHTAGKIDALIDICRIESESGECDNMIQYITEALTAEGYEYVYDDKLNIYAMNTPGLPMMVAHMDTVHSITGYLTPVIVGNNITGINAQTMKAQGIGGDDKVGIFIALTLFFEGLINVAFFVDEEIGCIGSYAADMDYIKNVMQPAYIMQCDRRGNADFVTNISGAIASKAFVKAVKPYLKAHKYEPSSGMMTDVMALSDNQVNVSCVNMSCGYYRPHCDDEYINIPDVLNCLSLCRAIVTNVTQHYPHTRQQPTWKCRSWDNWNDLEYSKPAYRDNLTPDEEVRYDKLMRMRQSDMTDAQYTEYVYLFEKKWHRAVG